MSAPKPSPWTDGAADFVEAFRDDVAVDVDVDAAWTQLQDAVEPSTAWHRAPLVLWFGAAAAFAAVMALLWVVASAASLQGEGPEPGQQAPDGAVPESAGIAPSRAVAPKRPGAPPNTPQTAAVVPVSEAPPESAIPRRPTAPPPDQTRETSPPESAPIASRLAEEVRLLDAIRAASKDGRHADALRRVQEHATSFASGSFAAERELARVRALCGLGRHEQVRLAQSGFAKSFPASHLASLVRNACPDAAEEIGKSDHDG